LRIVRGERYQHADAPHFIRLLRARMVDALAELPEHELEGWQRGNRLGLRILCELARRYPGIMQPTGPVRRKSA
jgi:hypothetical protein